MTAGSWLAAVTGRALGDVWHTFTSVWPFLVLSVVVAATLTTYVGADRLAAGLRRRTAVAVVGAVVLATLTPFCSCGTTALVLGAMASRVPWAPLVAFMVASPLTSPQEYVLSAGLFGMPFATMFFVAAIVLGLAAGVITHLIEKTGALAGQARMRLTGPQTARRTTDSQPEPSPSCCAPTESGTSGTASATRTLAPAAVAASKTGIAARYKVRAFAGELATTARRLALYFFGFATIGYLLVEAIPAQTLTRYLGGDSLWTVVIAALAGIPVYLNTDGSLPLVAALMHGGMGPGPALAFLVTGAGTSVGAISGMLVIARTRIVALVIGILFAGALLLGWTARVWL